MVGQTPIETKTKNRSGNEFHFEHTKLSIGGGPYGGVPHIPTHGKCVGDPLGDLLQLFLSLTLSITTPNKNCHFHVSHEHEKGTFG